MKKHITKGPLRNQRGGWVNDGGPLSALDSVEPNGHMVETNFFQLFSR